MGLREKVTITLVIIVLTQIACRHCMPRTSRKASLKRYLNDLKPVKNNPVSTPCSPSKVNKTPKQTFGKTAQNGRLSQNSLPKKSLYDTYNFPENEYPLDNAPRDRFRIGMNFNENYQANTLQKARNLQSSVINDLKKEMKMKRKLLSNKQVNNENIPLKTDMSSIKIASNPDSVRLHDSKTFPQVQYPLNTMETWEQNYWNYLPITQEKQLNVLGHQTLNPKSTEGINKPFTRLTKAKASKFLQSYDKLKEDQKHTSTENSKRNVGQKGLNFTKTATCERVTDDFITAGLLLNTLGNPSDTKTFDSSTKHIVNSPENTCPLIDDPNHPIPLPYYLFEGNTENVCPAFKPKNNTKELEDEDSSIIAKTLQLIEEILLHDDTSLKVPLKTKSKEKEGNENATEAYTDDSAKEDIPINLIDNAETSTVVPIDGVSDDTHLPSLPDETITENSTTFTIPLPINNGALTNTPMPDLTKKAGYASIIFIPMNNDSLSKSHMFDTTSDTPIIVYLPSIQTLPLNQIVHTSLGNLVPNNQLYNVISNMAPVQNDNPSSTAFVSELPNSISESGSSLPMYEPLPTNSINYNNENSPSSMRKKPVSDIVIHKSLTDVAPFVTPSCNEKLTQQPVETDENPDTLPQTCDSEHPVFDFADRDITSLSHGPHNSVLNNELPIIACEIDSNQQITKTDSKDLLIATQNITAGHSHKMTSLEGVLVSSLSGSPNGVLTVALNKNMSSETPTDSLEKFKNLHDSNLPVFTEKSTSPSPISKQNNESPQSINKVPLNLLVDTPIVQLPPPTQASLTPTPLSDRYFNKLPEIMDTKVLPTTVSEINLDSAPQPIDNTLVLSPILNKTKMTTDLMVKTELYKIRQILDRMLLSETPAVNQRPTMDTILSPILETDRVTIQTPSDGQPPPLDEVLSPIPDTDSLPLLEAQSLSPPIQTPIGRQPPPLKKVLSPIPDTESLPLLEEQSFSTIQTLSDCQPPPLDKVLSPIPDTDSLSLLEEQPLSPIQTRSDRQPPPLDKVLSPIPDSESLPLLEEQPLSQPNQTPIGRQPPPLKKVLSPIPDTESLPLVEEQLLSPTQTRADRPPPPLDKVLSPIPDTESLPQLEEQPLTPIQTRADRPPPPLDKVLSPIPDAESLPQLEEQPLTPIQTRADRPPPPFDKVLSPIPDTESLPLIEEQPLSHIQTRADRQPPPLDKVLSPISDTESLPPLEEQPLSQPNQTPIDRQPPPLKKVLSPIPDTESLPLVEEQLLSPIQTRADRPPSPLNKVLSPIPDTESLPQLEEQPLAPIQTRADRQPPPLDKVLSPIPDTESLPLQEEQPLSPIQTRADRQPPPLDKVLSPIPDTESLPLLEEQPLSPIQTRADQQPPSLDKVLSPIPDTENLPLLEEQPLSQPLQTPIGRQPPPLKKVLSPIPDTESLPLVEEPPLSPIQTRADRPPLPLDKVLSPIPDTENLPLVEEQPLSPIQTRADRPPPPLDKVLSPIPDTESLLLVEGQPLSPIQTRADRQPPPLHKVLSPIPDTESLPLVEEQPLSPIQTHADRPPPPLDKVLSPIPDTESLPLVEGQPLSQPIQTPIGRQPPPLKKVLSPIPDTDSLPQLEELPLSPIQTRADRQPPPLDKVLSPIPGTENLPLLEEQPLSQPLQTPIGRQPPPLKKVLSPIPDTESLPLVEEPPLSPIQTRADRPPLPLDKVLSPIPDTENLPLVEEQPLSPIQTRADRPPPPLDKVLSPIPDTESLLLVEGQPLSPIQTRADRQPPPLHKVLSPIPDTESLPLVEGQPLSPIQTRADRQPPPLHKVLSPIPDTESLPLVEEQPLSPNQTPTDRQPLLLGKVLSPIPDTDSLPLLEEQSLSHIETPTDRQPPLLSKVLSPIPDTDSLPLLEEQPLSPIQTRADRQPPPLDKVLSPIPDTESLPLLEEQPLSPIQTRADQQPPSLDKVLSPIPDTENLPLREEQPLSQPNQTPIGRQPPPLKKVLSPIPDTDSLPQLEELPLSPIQTRADRQPPPLDKVLSPIPDTESLPLLEEQPLSQPNQTPIGRQPPPLKKVLSPIPDTESLPLVEEQLLSQPIQTPIGRQPPPLKKVLSPIPDTDSLPQLEELPLSPIQTRADRQPPPLDKVLSPIPDTDSLPLVEEQPLSPIQTRADRQPPPLDKVLSPISDTESLPLLEEQPLSPIQTRADRQPSPLDKVLSPIPDTESLSLVEEQPYSPNQTPTDRQPPQLGKVLSPIPDTDSLPIVEEQTLFPLSETSTDRQPPPLDQELSTIRTSTDRQPPLDKLLSLISGSGSVPQPAGDKALPLPVTDNPIDSVQLQDQQTLLKTPINDASKDTFPSPMDKSNILNSVLESTDSLPQPLDETVPPIPLFQTTFDNKPYLVDNLETPLQETATSRTKDISNNDLANKMDNLPFGLELPDIYEVYDDDLLRSVDDLPIKVHQENSETTPLMVDLPINVIETPDLLSKTPVSDLLKPAEVLTSPVQEVVEIASPSLPSDSDTSLLSDSKDNEYQDFPPHKYPFEGLPALPMNKFKSPNHEVILNGQLHEISSEIQPQKYDLPLSEDKLNPDISLSDTLSIKPFILDDSPSPETDKILNFTGDNKNPLIDNRWLSPEDKASSDTLPTDIPTVVLPFLNLAQQSTYLNKTSDAVLSGPNLSDLHREDLPLPSNKTLLLFHNTLTNLLPSNKTLSTSKLPITKALLENVLSDITKGVLSSQVAKVLPVTQVSDKTIYETSPLTETKEIPLLLVENSLPNTKYNNNLIKNLHVSQITEDTTTTGLLFEFPLPIDKIYDDKPEISADDAEGENETQTSNNLSDPQLLPNNKISPLTDTVSDISRKEKSLSSKLPITKALLENVLSEINTNGFSIPVSKAIPATSPLVLDKTHYSINCPLSDFLLTEDEILPKTAQAHNNLPFSGQSEDTVLLEEDKTLSEIQSLNFPTEISSPMDKIVPYDVLPSTVTKILPYPNDTPNYLQLQSYKNKTPPSSKLPIAKALLENVLSDINTKGFSLPVATDLRGISRSQLDKTLYFLESQRPETTEESSVSHVPTENDHYSEITEDDFPLTADKVNSDNPIIDIPTDELISGKLYEDNSDDLTEEFEDSDETVLSDELTDDFLSEMEKPLSLDDMPDDLIVPLTKQLFSSRLPITKALLERVLSDLIEGAIAANNLLNHPNV